jgi:hypothetical protein
MIAVARRVIASYVDCVLYQLFTSNHGSTLNIDTYSGKFASDTQFKFLEIGMLLQGWEKKQQLPENLVSCFV